MKLRLSDNTEYEILRCVENIVTNEKVEEVNKENLDLFFPSTGEDITTITNKIKECLSIDNIITLVTEVGEITLKDYVAVVHAQHIINDKGITKNIRLSKTIE